MSQHLPDAMTQADFIRARRGCRRRSGPSPARALGREELHAGVAELETRAKCRSRKEYRFDSDRPH